MLCIFRLSQSAISFDNWYHFNSINQLFHIYFFTPWNAFPTIAVFSPFKIIQNAFDQLSICCWFNLLKRKMKRKKITDQNAFPSIVFYFSGFFSHFYYCFRFDWHVSLEWRVFVRREAVSLVIVSVYSNVVSGIEFFESINVLSKL